PGHDAVHAPPIPTGTAAPQAQAGTPSPRQVASWQSKVQSAVARHMQRTRFSGRGGSVTVTVRFSVDPGGRVAGASLASSTGDARIDAALSRQASRLPRLPAPPTGRTTSLVLPVKIVLR
ncbi:energy transducer TonB family protein, partial [Paracoccus thiocyanatus]